MKKVRLYIKGHDEVLNIVGALEKNSYPVNMDGFYNGAADIEFEVSDVEVVEDEEKNIELLKKPEGDEAIDKTRSEIEPKCDRINSLASALPYAAHREIQELLCEIMNLCKAESEDKNEHT